MKHGIVIPCYNEGKRLDKKAYTDFLRNTEKFEICFVNDGSSDHTLEVLNEIKQAVGTDNIFIYDMPKNGGKAEAVRQGSQFLYWKTRNDTIGFLDADLSTSFEEYALLANSIEKDRNLKMVFGSRNLSSKGIERDSTRGILSNIVKACIKLIIRMKIADTQCGAKVFRRDIVPFAYGSEFLTRWLFDVEIILRLNKQMTVNEFNNMFKEQALNAWIHAEGSKLGLKDSLEIPMRLAQIWKTYEFNPALKSVINNFNSSMKNPAHSLGPSLSASS